MIVRIPHPEHRITTLRPRESPILEHSVPLGGSPFRDSSAGTLQDVLNRFASDGAARIDNEVRFGVRGAPDDVVDVGKWPDRAWGIDGEFAVSLRVREAGLAALWGTGCGDSRARYYGGSIRAIERSTDQI